MPVRRTEGSGSHTVLEITTTFTIMVICSLMCVMQPPFEAVPFVHSVHFFRQRAVCGATTRTDSVPDSVPNRQVAERTCRYGTECRIRPHAAREHASCKRAPGRRQARRVPNALRFQPVGHSPGGTISAGRPLARRSRSLGKQPGFGSHPARQSSRLASSPPQRRPYSAEPIS